MKPRHHFPAAEDDGETTMQWAAPGLGLVIVKRILDRPASHPLGSGHLEGELVSVQRPR